MIRKILVICIVAVASVSCLPPSTMSSVDVDTATFEYDRSTYLEHFGEDSLFFDVNAKIGFSWHMLAFYHKINSVTSEFQGGFMMSYLKYPKTMDVNTMPNNKYRANAKLRPESINTYAVFEQSEDMPDKDMGFLFEPSNGVTGSCVMNYCFVNNTVAAAKAVEENFVLGDKMMLKARGYLAGKETGVAEIMLAEKTTARDSIMSSWTFFDLSPLGSIDEVDFEIVLPEDRGVPATVCIDDVEVTISMMYQ